MQLQYAKLTNISGGIFSLFNISMDFEGRSYKEWSWEGGRFKSGPFYRKCELDVRV